MQNWKHDNIPSTKEQNLYFPPPFLPCHLLLVAFTPPHFLWICDKITNLVRCFTCRVTIRQLYLGLIRICSRIVSFLRQISLKKNSRRRDENIEKLTHHDHDVPSLGTGYPSWQWSRSLPKFSDPLVTTRMSMKPFLIEQRYFKISRLPRSIFACKLTVSMLFIVLHGACVLIPI